MTAPALPPAYQPGVAEADSDAAVHDCRSATSLANALSELASDSTSVSVAVDLSVSCGVAWCWLLRVCEVCSAERMAMRRFDSAINAWRVSEVM